MIQSDDPPAVAAAIRKFDPAMVRRIAEVRAALRERFPTAYELVWDNYNFFVIAYCATEKPSSGVVSLAADANGIGLHFLRGADLPDPHRILLGAGAQNRFIRLVDGAATLARADVQDLLREAEARLPTPMRATGTTETLLRSVSAKQRPRRRPPTAR